MILTFYTRSIYIYIYIYIYIIWLHKYDYIYIYICIYIWKKKCISIYSMVHINIRVLYKNKAHSEYINNIMDNHWIHWNCIYMYVCIYSSKYICFLLFIILNSLLMSTICYLLMGTSPIMRNSPLEIWKKSRISIGRSAFLGGSLHCENFPLSMIHKRNF